VFILQISGAKRWNVFEPAVTLPLRSRPGDEEARKRFDNPLLEVEVQPGDLLYIPRGFPHHAVSTQSTSLHLTVGAHTITWAAVMRAALDEHVQRDPRLRESLPPGFADDDVVREKADAQFQELIRALADAADGAATLNGVAEVIRRQRRVVGPGRFLDVESAAQVSGETRVRRRSDVDCTVEVDDDRLRLLFNGKAVTLPAFAVHEVQQLLSADECRADELPGDIDQEGRLVIIRSLVREGLLTICR
jgi:ribosomal protein L16 Arg81 hydroxylase